MSNSLSFSMLVLCVGCSGQSATSATAAVNGTSPTAPSAPVVATAGSSAGIHASLAGTAGGPQSSASIAGGTFVVSNSGTASAEPSVGDSAVASEPQLGTLRGHISTQPAQAAKHAVVYLENGPVGKVIDAKLDDHKMVFYPYVSVMTVGGTLTYVNSEPFPDTAFSPSHEKWDFGLVESRGTRKRKFNNPGDYSILCQLHPNQLAFLLVTPSSYFARADKKGDFILKDVPIGTYDVVAWAPRVKSSKQSVAVVANGEVDVSFELKR